MLIPGNFPCRWNSWASFGTRTYARRSDCTTDACRQLGGWVRWPVCSRLIEEVKTAACAESLQRHWAVDML